MVDTEKYSTCTFTANCGTCCSLLPTLDFELLPEVEP